MTKYPQDLAEAEYIDSMIGPRLPEPSEINDLNEMYPPIDVSWIGDTPKIEYTDETLTDRDDRLDAEQE